MIPSSQVDSFDGGVHQEFDHIQITAFHGLVNASITMSVRDIGVGPALQQHLHNRHFFRQDGQMQGRLKKGSKIYDIYRTRLYRIFG